MELLPVTVFLDVVTTNHGINVGNNCSHDSNYPCDSKVNRQEKVSITSLRRSNFFHGYLDIVQLSSSSCNEVLSVPFPPQFNDVVDTYVTYCNLIQTPDEDNINFVIYLKQLCVDGNQQGNYLFRVFELAHFLDDDKLFSCAMKILYEHYSYYKDSICSLNSDIQHDIKLHLPYMFGYANDRNYPNAWFSVNDGKIIRVENTYYVTHLSVSYNFASSSLLPHDSDNNDGNSNEQDRCVDDRSITITCYSGPVIPTSGVKLYSNGVTRYWTRKIGGHITYEVHYSDNVKHGPETQWIIKDTNDNNNHHVLWCCNYANGKLDGEYKKYNDDGKLHEVTNYCDGVANDEQLVYHPDGITVMDRRFNVGGKTCGPWTEYYPDGKINGQGTNIPTMLLGISQDITFWYYPVDQGLEMQTITSNDTNNDNSQSTVKTWYSLTINDNNSNNNNNSCDTSLSYIQPLPTSIVSSPRLIPSTSQVLQSMYTIVNNKTHGDYYTWYPNGNTRTHFIFDNDKNHGLCCMWYDADGSDDDTNLKCYHNYKHGKRHGLWKEWYPNGVLQGEYNYVDDVKHGVCRVWHPNGNIWYSATYNNDVIDDSQPVVLLTSPPSSSPCCPSSYSPFTLNDVGVH